MKAFMALALIAASPPTTATPSTQAHRAIMTAMEDSASGWTAGDLHRFMEVYADRATFVAGDGIIRGKAAIAARYAPRFAPDKAMTRGALTFEELDFRLLDSTHALLVARYRLKTTGRADQTGPTSLVFEKMRSGWKIVADHSS